jgi:hypothetical protein
MFVPAEGRRPAGSRSNPLPAGYVKYGPRDVAGAAGDEEVYRLGHLFGPALTSPYN